jgi:hypothetical protein
MFTYMKVEVKVTLEQATKAQKGRVVWLCSFFTLGAGWGWVVNATLGNDPVTIV